MDDIQYVSASHIDTDKWNACIAHAYQGRVYGTSMYLDAVNPGWAALIMGNYEWVMPLPIHQKWGISYLAQPWFCQQLGLFGPAQPDHLLLEAFLWRIPRRFVLVDMNLNHTNPLPPLSTWEVAPRHNYELTLNQSYDELYQGYKKNNRTNLRKARKYGLVIDQKVGVEEMILLKKRNEKVPISPQNYRHLSQLLHGLVQSGQANIWGTLDAEGDLLAAVCLVEGKRYLTYLLASSSEAGKHQRAMFFLIDEIIQAYANSQLVFDFEGSMIPGVARFYEGFGASPILFHRIRKKGWVNRFVYRGQQK